MACLGGVLSSDDLQMSDKLKNTHHLPALLSGLGHSCTQVRFLRFWKHSIYFNHFFSRWDMKCRTKNIPPRHHL